MTDESTTVVLGWDGLDHKLVEQYGFHDEFGEYNKQIRSVDNPLLDSPSTYELWPSIITGEHPEIHGLRVLTKSGGASMSNPIGDALSNSLHNLLPERARVKLALALRNRGVTITQKRPRYYRNQGLGTVFDDRISRPIGIPNFRTKMDDDMDIISGWNSEMASYMEVMPAEQEDRMIYKPRVDARELEDWAVGLAGNKIGLVISSLTKNYDLVFAWISMLDNFGHTAPVVNKDDWQYKGYRHAANLTQTVRDALGRNDDLFVISDHGHRDARHTHTAHIGSDTPGVIDGVRSILEIRNCVDRVTTKRDEVEESIQNRSITHRDTGKFSI